MKELFLGILSLIRRISKDELQAKCRYLDSVKINALFELIEEMELDIDEMGFASRARETSNSNVFTYSALSNKNDIGMTTNNIPQFCF